MEGNPARNKKSIRASTTYIKAFGYDGGFYSSKSARSACLDYMTTSGVTVSLLSTSDTLGAQKAAYSASSRSTIPDASLSKEDRDVMLTLSPAFKERFQRFQAVYHVRIVWLERDAIEVGFYSEDAIYGPLYYGCKPDALAIRQGRELEKELPSDTILVLLTASSDVIVKRMENSPHEFQIIRREDIPLLLQKFEEEYGASTIHAKIRIDTTDQSPEEALQEFLNKARPYLASEDLLRIVANEYRRRQRAATAVFMCDMKLRRAGRAHVLQPLFEGLLRALSWSTSCSSH